MLEQALILAILGGIGVAAAAGPLGTFIVWKRMAYFGDSLAHSALLGIGLGLFLHIDLTIAVLATSFLYACTLMTLQKSNIYSKDTLMGLMAHGALATGLVVLAFAVHDQGHSDHVHLEEFLLGNVMELEKSQVITIIAGALAALAYLSRLWRPLLLLTVHEDIAKVEGVKVERVQFQFILLLSVLVALAVQVVGVLLVTSLLIIPAATARRLIATPESMAILSGVIGIFAVIAGIFTSQTFATPPGPTIVVIASAFFLGSLLIKAHAKIPNTKTMQAIKNAEHGKNLKQFENTEELFEDWDKDKNK